MKRLSLIFGLVLLVLSVGAGIRVLIPRQLAEEVVLSEEPIPAISLEVAELAAQPEPLIESAPLAVTETLKSDPASQVVEQALPAPVVIAVPVKEESAPAPVAVAECGPKQEFAPAPVAVSEPVKEESVPAPVVVAEPAPKQEAAPAPVVIAEPVKEESVPAPVVVAEPALAPLLKVDEREVAAAQPSAPAPEPASCQPSEPSCAKKCKPPIKKVVKPCVPKVCKPCCTPPPACCWKFNPCNPKGCTDMNCGGFFLTADFLYWASENHGFSYAYQIDSSNVGVGKVMRLGTSWDPGFRVGLGWNTTYNFWDLYLNYTWYQNHASSSHTNTFGYINMWPVSSATTGEFTSVSASSRLHLNMVDLELGRLIYLTKAVALRPHIGLKGGTLDQKFSDHFEGRLSGSNSQLKFSGKNNYGGCGPRFGLDGEWHLDWGFSILGKFAGALLYGSTNAKSLSTQLPTGSTTFGINRQYKDSFNQLVPNLQLSLGFQWQTCFACEKMFYRLSLAWEANYWWDQFNLPVAMSSYAPLPSSGNQALTTEGVTFKNEWNF